MSSMVVRRRQRHAMRRTVRVDCEVVREHDFKLVARRAIDLSPDGMLVLSDTRVLTGEDVIVTFRAPTTRLWMDCMATVARVVHGRRPGDWGICLGLSFDAMDEVTRTLLSADLRGLPPPVPSREPRIDYAETVRKAARAPGSSAIFS
jgi:PilZ domain